MAQSRPNRLAAALQMCACVMTVLCSAACVASGPEEPRSHEAAVGQAAATFDIVVRKIDLQRLLGDRAQLSAEVEVLPHIDAQLHAVSFRGIRLNRETPVYIEPFEGNYTLHSGQPLLLPHARLSVYYSDFPTPSAMDDMLAAGRVDVRGEVLANLQISFIAKLLTHDMHPVVALSLQQTVPFDEDAVDVPTQLGIGLLAAAQRAVGTSASILDRVAGVRVHVDVDPVSETEREATVLVRTTYRIKEKSVSTVYRCERLGFRTDAEHLLVPAEVLEPWAYSIEAAQMIAADPGSLDIGFTKTVVEPADMPASGQQSMWAVAQQGFQVERRGHPPSVRLLTAGGQPFSLLERESTENYAVLRLGANHGRPEAATDGERGEVSALRRASGTDQPLRRIVLGEEELHAGSPLPRPVDETLFGSPLMVNGAVVGMVVAETTWVSLSAVAIAETKIPEVPPHERKVPVSTAPP